MGVLFSDEVRADSEVGTGPKPTPASEIIFRIKTSLLQTRRIFQNIFSGDIQQYSKGEMLRNETVIAESKSKLWSNNQGAELKLEAGKVHNLRMALRRLNGVEIPAGRVFSFWSQVGLPVRWKGYARGRELREGCIIPSVGGGLCQLSNALYDAALSAGFKILERHAHSKVIPGSLAEVGRDATVFWNYVDLRFKSNNPFRIEILMTSDELIVRLKSEKIRRTALPVRAAKLITPADDLQSCASCNVQSCFKHIERKKGASGFERSAYLVDEYWPELDEYISDHKSDKDILGLPINGKKFNKQNYAWSASGFQKVSESRLTTIIRAIESRNLSPQGATRQKALLRNDERLASSFAPLLGMDVTHVTVMQNLLPFLWNEGYLGGRTFDVLMTRLPLADLHKRLDRARQLHAESETLTDFRAAEWLVRAESEALKYARKIVTPHTDIAALFKEKAVVMDWLIPGAKREPIKGNKVLFPASTLGRKGAYEMREAARALNLDLVLIGSQLEGTDFWRGVPISCRRFDERWLDEIGLVVLPAFIEHKPRRLLEAVAHKVPVIASTACGLGNVAGVVNVPAGDAQSLFDEIQRWFLNAQEANAA
ncbi:MAG TPA: VanW family protein [Blastocatellia bacterium]|nr:VanW family protein [Blastocatellia bacterium]